MLLSCIALSVSAQQTNPNRLRPCPKDQTARYHNCFGTYKSPEGDVYVGEFKDDKFHGQGTLTFADGYKYVGEFKDDKFHGQGTFTFANGKKYVGEFKDDKFHGQGTFTFANGEKYVGEFKDDRHNGQGIFTFANGAKYMGEWKDGDRHGQGIHIGATGLRKEGIWANNSFIREEKVNLPNLDNNVANNTHRADIERERQQLAEERRRLEEDKRQREQQRQVQRINIQASHTQPAADGSTTITVQTNADTASLLINGEEQGGKVDGKYTIKKVARVGQDTQFKITATDINGNSDTKIITVTRQAVPSSTTQVATLKPETINRSQPRDAVAIIIGIQNYKRVPNADFANNDAREFSEYAIRALGIKPEKIKMLLDDEADEVNIVKAFENWLPIQVNKDKTDVYVFYSGHGLPSSDGKSLYFLPHGVDKELLSRTAVAQNDIIAALTAAKPKSVTMFIDACYSGQTRGGDVLLANAKPVSLKADKHAYPPNFIVITASANDQISSSSPELKHGIFSFYLMKGMEGDADANQDGKITVGEMQDYLSDKVARQAMTMNRNQNTQLLGDSSRILVVR